MDVTVNLFTFLCYCLLLFWKFLSTSCYSGRAYMYVSLCHLAASSGLSPVFPEKHFFFNFSPERVWVTCDKAFGTTVELLFISKQNRLRYTMVICVCISLLTLTHWRCVWSVGSRFSFQEWGSTCKIVVVDQVQVQVQVVKMTLTLDFSGSSKVTTVVNDDSSDGDKDPVPIKTGT